MDKRIAFVGIFFLMIAFAFFVFAAIPFTQEDIDKKFYDSAKTNNFRIFTESDNLISYLKRIDESSGAIMVRDIAGRYFIMEEASGTSTGFWVYFYISPQTLPAGDAYHKLDFFYALDCAGPGNKAYYVPEDVWKDNKELKLPSINSDCDSKGDFWDEGDFWVTGDTHAYTLEELLVYLKRGLDYVEPVTPRAQESCSNITECLLKIDKRLLGDLFK